MMPLNSSSAALIENSDATQGDLTMSQTPDKVKKMKAMMLPQFGGVDRFRLEEVERLSPKPGEVLIRIAGTSVNPVDVAARAGERPQMFSAEDLPLLLGFDASGRVEELGAGVTDWKIGDAVYGFPATSPGTFAEYVCLRADEIAAPPQSIPLADAGAVPLASMTAWHGLMTQGEMQSGQRVLIQGGSGGVGHFAVQFAHRLGATVYATASGKNQDFLRELGADVAIDYNTEQLQEFAGQMDLVFDCAFRQAEERSWAALKPDGLLVLAAGEPNLALARSPKQRGRFAVAQSSRDDLAHVARMLDDRHLRLTISERFKLEQVGEAQTRLKRGGFPGKLMVAVSQEA
jgi:NADPH:quinone reductase-like Zn-dependent oxidoreductase